jgi:hypothetical protein
MGVSLFSAAATSVSMFRAEPNPVKLHYISMTKVMMHLAKTKT